MENLEKALKKTSRIKTLLIVIVALMLIYAIIVWGDISSAKEKVRNEYADEIAAIQTELADIETDTKKAEDKIAGYEADIAEHKAVIEAIENGTYTGEAK